MTILSPQWDFLYWKDDIFILNWGPGSHLFFATCRCQYVPKGYICYRKWITNSCLSYHASHTGIHNDTANSHIFITTWPQVSWYHIDSMAMKKLKHWTTKHTQCHGFHWHCPDFKCMSFYCHCCYLFGHVPWCKWLKTNKMRESISISLDSECRCIPEPNF